MTRRGGESRTRLPHANGDDTRCCMQTSHQRRRPRHPYRKLNEALELLRGKALPDGGFPAEHRYYRSGPSATGQRSLVDWGPTSNRRMNEWVTVRALKVLQSREDP
jgi:hypothetical protein